MELVDPCQDTVIDIDASIVDSHITYGVYLENIAEIIVLDQSLVVVGDNLSLCPLIEFSITQDNGKPMNDKIFSFQAPNQLIINTRDTSLVGEYDMKLHARFQGDRYTQRSELPFSVTLIEECANAVVLNPGDNDIPRQFYYYNGRAEFKLENSFLVQPAECRIIYTCEEERYNLCSTNTDDTKVSFNTQTGTLQFQTTDNEMYGTQEISFKITGLAGASSESVTYNLNLVDPCSLSALSMNPQIIESTITYGIYERNSEYQLALDPAEVVMTPASTLCPSIRFAIENEDGSPLDSDIFNFDSESNTFSISTQNPEHSGTYDLKIIASFDSDRYTQMDEQMFRVQLLNFTNDPQLQYQSLEVLEVPARVQWPSPEEAYEMPQKDLVLSEIRYKQDKDYMELSGLQLAFANGVESPLIEARDGPQEQLFGVRLDINRPVRYVRMKMYYGIYYSAIWLMDDDGNTIIKQVFMDLQKPDDHWWPAQEIPRGQHIIGFKCEPLGYEHGLNHVSFLLGKIGEPGIVGELKFPDYQVYPNFQKYQQLQAAGSFSKLSQIYYKQETSGKYLSGIQLGFEDGSKSFWMEQQDAVEDPVQVPIQIDTSRRIHAISMKMVKRRNFEGLRLYDEDMNIIVERVWDWTSDFKGIWDTPQVIPKGKQIIGVKTSGHENWIRFLSFVLGPE